MSDSHFSPGGLRDAWEDGLKEEVKRSAIDFIPI